MPEYILSDAELFIMRFFWDRGALHAQDLAPLVAEKKWKPTTLLTFLDRLAKKGMLQIEKEGKANLYTPCISYAQYSARESQTLLDTLHNGSAQNFLACMMQTNGLSAEEMEKIKAWIAKQEVD